MSNREMKRGVILAQVKSGAWTLVEAAERMEVSYRQAKRLWKRYQRNGTAGLVMAVLVKDPIEPSPGRYAGKW
jgi:hypothetical protein